MARPDSKTCADRPRTRLTGIGGVSLLLLVTLVVSGPARATPGMAERDDGAVPSHRAVLGQAASTTGVTRRAQARTAIRPAAVAAERVAMLRRVPAGAVSGEQAELPVGIGLVRAALLDLPPPSGAAH